jgi:hypothetical protein
LGNPERRGETQEEKSMSKVCAPGAAARTIVYSTGSGSSHTPRLLDPIANGDHLASDAYI